MPKAPFRPGIASGGLHRCVDSEHFAVEAARGWAFVSGEDTVDKASGQIKHQNKPGWLATTDGASLRVKVKTRFMRSPPEKNVSLTISYLVSYEQMGDAVLTCASGCACEETLLKGTCQEEMSVTNSVTVEATQALHCSVEFVARASANGAKVKLLGMSVRTR